MSASVQAVRGLTLTAQLSRGFRDPMLSDRYYRGPTGRGFITGNPDLQSETSLQIDTALRLTTRRVRAGLFAYRYRIDGLVERYQTTPDDFFFRNRGRADIRGVELEVLADLPGRTTVEVAATVQRGTAADGRTALDGISAPTLSTQVRRALGRRGYAQLRAGWIRRDDRPGPTERLVPAATLLDAGAGATIGGLELRLLMRNLLDWSYLASQDVRAVAAAGRSASLTAVIRF